MTTIEYMMFVALCAASISYTICCSGIFMPLREYVSKWHPKIEELIHCPYCLCHYVIFTIMVTTRNIKGLLIQVTGILLYDFLFTLFAIVCMTSLMHCIMLIAYKPVMRYMADRKIAQMQMQNKRK